MPVSVKVEKLNPAVQVVHYDTIELNGGGTDRPRCLRRRSRRRGDQRQSQREILAADPGQAAQRRMSRREASKAKIIGLSVAYALLGLLLLLAVTRARLPWPVKAAAVVLTSAFYIVVFFRTQGLLGWSALDPLPARFQLLWRERRAQSCREGARRDPSLARGARRREPAERQPAPTACPIPRASPRRSRPPAPRSWPAVRSAAAPWISASAAASSRPTPPPRRPVPASSRAAIPRAAGLLDPAFLGGDAKSVEFAPLPVPKLPAKDLPTSSSSD